METSPTPADELSARLERRYAAVMSWSADFTQTTFVDALGQTITRSGRIKVRRPGNLRIDYDSEPRRLYLMSGGNLWIYQPDIRAAEEYGDPERILSREALVFLSGLDRLGEVFDVLPELKEPEDAGLKFRDTKLKRVSLLPRDKDSPVLRLILGVEAKRLTLKEALLFNASGNVTHYGFSAMEFDREFPATDFTLPRDGNIRVTVHGNADE